MNDLYELMWIAAGWGGYKKLFNYYTPNEADEENDDDDEWWDNEDDDDEGWY